MSCEIWGIFIHLYNNNILNRSLGLITPPKLRFLQKNKDSLKNAIAIKKQKDEEEESHTVQHLKNNILSEDNDSSDKIAENSFTVKAKQSSTCLFKISKYLNYLCPF